MQISVMKEPLKANEVFMLPMFIKAFKRHVEKENAIKSSKIQELYKQWYYRNRSYCIRNGQSKQLSAAAVCRIIRHIRLNHLIRNLVANNAGYYVTFQEHELARYYHSIKHRGNAILDVAVAIAEDYGKLVQKNSAYKTM